MRAFGVIGHRARPSDRAPRWDLERRARSRDDRGYCPQYTHAPYYDSSTVCRSTAMTGVPPTGRFQHSLTLSGEDLLVFGGWHGGRSRCKSYAMSVTTARSKSSGCSQSRRER